ncbi:hypothetical protein BC940DRAFT_18318 [Gongronella butleri]|nr:hypothetical protein BC940DRAFT_18318 [Gongronella butleri]
MHAAAYEAKLPRYAILTKKHTPARIMYLVESCGVPEEMVDDDDVVEVALQARAEMMSRRPRQTPRIRSGKPAYKHFIMAKVHVAASGWAKVRVEVDDKVVMEKHGMYVTNAIPPGEDLLDVDPLIRTDAILVKSVQTHQPVKDRSGRDVVVSDAQLLDNAKDTYLKAFERTLDQFDLKLRPEITRAMQSEPWNVAVMYWLTSVKSTLISTCLWKRPMLWSIK